MSKKSDVDDNVLIEKPCSVSAFDLRVRLQRDGRERGLWFNILDDSEARIKQMREWFNAELEEAIKAQLIRLPVELSEEMISKAILGIQLWMASDRHRVDESGLIEWHELQEVYNAIGAELKKRKK